MHWLQHPTKAFTEVLELLTPKPNSLSRKKTVGFLYGIKTALRADQLVNSCRARHVIQPFTGGLADANAIDRPELMSIRLSEMRERGPAECRERRHADASQPLKRTNITAHDYATTGAGLTIFAARPQSFSPADKRSSSDIGGERRR
jgi:hypothetical protein